MPVVLASYHAQALVMLCRIPSTVMTQWNSCLNLPGWVCGLASVLCRAGMVVAERERHGLGY